MKIHILFPFVNGPYGGANQFLKSLRKELKIRNAYENDPKKTEIILFNSFQNLSKILLYKLIYPQKIFIHRVDGPISDYRGQDEEIDKQIYQVNELIADGTILQSDWSKKNNYAKGMRKSKDSVVILNSCDKSIFNNRGSVFFDRKKKIKLIAVSWSNNKNKGFKYYEYLDKNLDFSKFEMTFIGNSRVKFKNIRILPPLTSDGLSHELKNHHIYVIASKNDPCSNSLIEALSCGLPAVYLKSGGHVEIVKNAGVGFANEHELKQAIKKIVNNYFIYKNRIHISDMQMVAKAYSDFAKYLEGKKQYKSIRFGETIKIFLEINTYKLRKIMKITI